MLKLYFICSRKASLKRLSRDLENIKKTQNELLEMKIIISEMKNILN